MNIIEYALGFIQGKALVNSISLKDGEKAFIWYQKAADAGYAAAQGNLGYCYANGIGVAQNYEKSCEWLQKAVDQGNADAQFQLGCCYLMGRGVPQDKTEAIYWLEKARDKGSEDAKKILNQITTP